jgi:peptide/nickel transport system substrate-binding protein
LRTSVRVLLGAVVAMVLGTAAVLLGTAAGGTAPSAAHTAAVPVVTILYGAAPDYLDPQESYTAQGDEALWVSYLGLYTYAHRSGEGGGVVIPALATKQPTITDHGRTYTMTLRKNLVYSNGVAVKASDFTYSIERALKLNWGGDSFYTSNIVGAGAYAKGTSKTISGITTNNATRTVRIHLLAPYGAFENILAFPSSGLVPIGTAMTDLTSNPPPGVGPYMITSVVLNRSWVGAINPRYAREAIPGIPAGKVRVDARVEVNTATETEDVLNNSADLFDTGDQVTPGLLGQIKSQAANRYSTTPVEQTDYFFLNTTIKPFNSQLVREAVTMAIDRNALSRLDGGNLAPGCYFLPSAMIGQPSRPCPYGSAAGPPNVAKAKKLIAQARDTGAPVSVYSGVRQPKAEFATYYASVLSSLGFRVTIKPVADSAYFTTVGNLKLNAQTGFDNWLQDFPNPADFYQNNLDAQGIQQTNNVNLGQVNDPKIQKALTKLYAIPSGQLTKYAGQWQALDYYTAQKAYALVLGYPVAPMFASNRLDYHALVVQPSYGWDWTSIQLKK